MRTGPRPHSTTARHSFSNHRVSAVRTRAVVFDLFGTLIPPWPAGAVAELGTAWARVLRVDAERFRTAWAADRVSRELGTLDESLMRVCAALEVPLPRADVVVLEWERRRAISRRLLMAPRANAVMVLSKLRGLGIATAVISDCAAEVPPLWPSSPLAEFIDAPLFSCRERLKKPDHRLYQRACARLAVDPTSCVYVGDGMSDELEGAMAVGMQVAQLRPGDTEHIPEWNGRIIRSLDEVMELTK